MPVDTLDQKMTKRGLKLRGFQKIGIEWLAARDRALLCDEMGTGKTCQALLALPEENRARSEKAPPVLVICPANAKHVWAQKEGPKWRPDLKPFILEGEGSFRWPAVGEMLVTNYDVLPDPGDVHQAPPTGCIIVADEAHYLKNPRARRTVRFKALAEKARYDKGRTWLLTGTPLLSHPLDLWSLASCAGLAQEHFGLLKSFKELFGGVVTKKHACRQCGHKEPAKEGSDKCPKRIGKKACSCDAHVTETEEWGQPSAEVRERFAKFALRRLRSEVLPELPGKTYEDVPVVLSAQASEAIDEELVDDWEAALTEALDTQGGVSFTELASARRAIAEAKIPAMLEIVEEYEEQDTPLVVFSAHRAPLDHFLEREGWGVITGDTPSKTRSQIETDFQAGKLKGVAANIKAGGTAITLTYGSNMLFVDREYNPGDNLQAEDRCVRLGQESAVLIKRLIADHRLDQRLAEILDTKTKMIVDSLGK